MNRPLKILYLGDDHPNSTSRHRADALRRIGCEVVILNPRGAYARLGIHRKIQYVTGYRLVAPLVTNWLMQQVNGEKFDLVWNDQCTSVSRKAIEFLDAKCDRSVCFAIDDPTGRRDGNRWDTLRKTIPLYDCFVGVRVETEQEIRLIGGKRSLRVWMGYDEVAHAPFTNELEIPKEFRSEAAFVGTFMKGEGRLGRDYILLKLIEAGIPVNIWGERWYKSQLWPRLKPFWRGGALGGREYVAAIQGAKICLGFLSKGNRDLHTTRTAEIPYAGGLLCAERTSEHQQLYQDGIEAVFWSSPEECVDRCLVLLRDQAQREQIRSAGRARIRSLGLGNETICRKILVELGYEAFRTAATDSLFRMQAIV